MNNVVSNDIKITINRKGTISLILGVLSIVTSFMAVGLAFGIIGLIYGVIGVREVNRFNQNGKRKVITGVICCILGIFLTSMFSIIAGMSLFN
ncbi:hypothetical protein ACFVR1_19195 [Psychrobacillus sp. NPDC058041]|uniref:hypothetical protein n=1 Tax=Psychrobacillus sp. NPDC058041 TaxID=3346310 RepID=UPI0036DBE593